MGAGCGQTTGLRIFCVLLFPSRPLFCGCDMRAPTDPGEGAAASPPCLPHCEVVCSPSPGCKVARTPVTPQPLGSLLPVPPCTGNCIARTGKQSPGQASPQGLAKPHHVEQLFLTLQEHEARAFQDAKAGVQTHPHKKTSVYSTRALERKRLASCHLVPRTLQKQ